MRHDTPRLLDAGSHQKSRPVHCMEAKNILSYQMQRGPIFLEADGSLLLFVAEPDRRDVVSQRFEPDIHRVIRIIRDRDTPTHRGPWAAD